MSGAALAHLAAGFAAKSAEGAAAASDRLPLRIRVLGYQAPALEAQLRAEPAAAERVVVASPKDAPGAPALADVDLVLFALDPAGTEGQQLRSLRLAFPAVTMVALLSAPDPALEAALGEAGADACLSLREAEGPAFVRLLHQTHRLHQLEARFAARSQALDDHQQHFQSLVWGSADGLLVLDPDGVIDFVNPAAAAMFGRSVEDLLGSELGHPVTDSSAEIEILGPGRAVGVAEMRVEAHRWHGRPALLALLRDVTRFKEAEARLRATTLEVEARNRELEDFAVIVSHDLQEPLRKIRLFGRRLAERCEAALDDDGKVALGHMLSAAERMRGLLLDLLDLTRVSAGQRSFVDVELGSLALEVTRDLAAALAESQGRIECRDLPTVRGEPAQLRLVLQNLFANALKYRRPDVAPHVSVAGLPGEPGTRAFVVADNGIGFEQSHAERIFAPFQRLHPAHVYAGSGIGLAICRKIVEHHRGRIEAFGEPGRGARFVVTLPLQPEGVL